jgi:protein CpxP
MMMRASTLYTLALSLCAALPGAVYAQAPTVPPPPPVAAPATAPASAGKPSATQAAVEQRITALQTKLAITADQQAAWSDFAQVMRDNAQNTDTLFQQRAQGASTMTAVDNMKSYAAIARAYADNTEHLSAAFATLYGKLSQPQQQTADVLFRQPSASTPKKSSSRR